VEDTDFHELGRQLLTEFGGIHQRVSRFVDKALSGEMAVMRALMLAGGSLTPSELADRAWVSNARIANILRALEAKGYVGHKTFGSTYQYYPVVTEEEFSRRTLGGVISKYFENSYLGAVSALVEEEKISVEDLRELIDRIENQNRR
jgi:predicted transcriptional regulator